MHAPWRCLQRVQCWEAEGRASAQIRQTRDDTTYEFPAWSRNIDDTFNRLHVNVVANDDLRDPDGAEKVSPLAGGRLLEGTPLLGTKHT